MLLDAESEVFPRALLGRCSSALLLFCSGRMGAADGHWVREAGLVDVTAVDWDGATLEPFADEYPVEWDYVEADVFDWVGSAARRWDLVSADAPSHLAGRLEEMLPRYCALARRYVVATLAVTGPGAPVAPCAPARWRYVCEPVYRTEFEGRRFWWLVLERETEVAFDDGPCDTTGRILDILAVHDTRAVFFVNGKNISGREHLLERMVAEGHEIGNHGWSHRALVDDGITLPEVLEEIQSTHDAIVAAAGVAPTRFRTPFVRWSPEVHTIAAALGYVRTYADPSFGDYRMTPGEIVAASAGRERLWLHDGVEATVEALPRVLEARDVY